MAQRFYSLPEVSFEEFQKRMNQGQFLTARPQDMTFEEFLARSENNPAIMIIDNIPLNLNMAFIKAQNPDIASGFQRLEQLRSIMRLLNIGFYLLIFVTFGLILLAAKITSRSLLGFLSKAGTYFLAAFVVLAIFLALKLATNNLLTKIITEKAVQLPQSLKNEIILPFAQSTHQKIFNNLFILSSILGGVGIILFISPIIYKRFFKKF